LAQVADMARNKIIERTAAGRATAREHLRTTGRTHNRKFSMGRPRQAAPVAVTKWKQENKASISPTAEHFSLSLSTVKRYCAL
jgi:putative DNA-invertase from lambdoid prophage Rac